MTITPEQARARLEQKPDANRIERRAYRTIAGMEWEYGVEQAIGTTQWFRSRPMAEAHAEVRGAYRLVRRLVSKPKEIS